MKSSECVKETPEHFQIASKCRRNCQKRAEDVSARPAVQSRVCHSDARDGLTDNEVDSNMLVLCYQATAQDPSLSN